MLAHPAKTRRSPAWWLGSAERSERQVALGRRTARIRRIDGLCVPAEVRENPLDRCGRLNAGDHMKAAAAAPVVADLMRAGLRHECGKSRDKILGLDKIAGSDFGQPKAGPEGAGQDARSKMT